MSERVKIVHLAGRISPTGDVSPRCAVRPRPIDLRRATWTNRPVAVTCRRCLAVLAQGPAL